ncbi:hypothetical protein M5K25_006472 [Dendrobium thyrsiflorum]|uniref:CCT domain-containing protein n=1 Tax=Dendrobium thyrsiflorum TaxID=117978 RepID=A0ABD0VIW8_DENTH
MFNSSYDSPSSTSLSFIDLPGGLICSGELQHTKASLSDGGAGATSSGVKVERYSSKDRRERIERYRSKRNQRNFHKKITYACRKTLADSRPRVRGRFARHDEAEQETDSPESGAAAGSDWWRKMKAALTAAGEECYYDELWASLDSAYDMNLSSSPIV